MAVIYRIVNVANDNFYIGSATNFRRRKWEHLAMLKDGRHHCAALQTAWAAFGPEAFEFEIVEEVEDAVALQIEDTHLLRHAGTPECYNTAQTSMRGPSEDSGTVRAKISATLSARFANKEKHPRYGKRHTDEAKAKISAAKKANPQRYWEGKTRSEETRKKIGDAQRGVARGPKVFTPEGLERARENMRRNAREQTPLPFEDVLRKFPAEVQERYDFSKAVYTGALVRIEDVVCAEHGIFSQYAAQFRKGRGCPACGAQVRAVKKQAEMLQARK